MKLKYLLMLVSCLLVNTLFVHAEAITESNWQNHPAIKEIRAIVSEIEEKLKTKSLTEEKVTAEYSGPGVPTLQVIDYDSARIVRKYVEESGSEDSNLKFTYYYDSKQKLRFVFITGGAMNGSQLEHRIYFNANAKKIWEIQKYTKGPGYTFPKVWPENQLVFDPWDAFKG